jgi:hypothetical protein
VHCCHPHVAGPEYIAPGGQLLPGSSPGQPREQQHLQHEAVSSTQQPNQHEVHIDAPPQGGHATTSPPPRHAATAWGQALQPLPATVAVTPGQVVQLGVMREGPTLHWALLGVDRSRCPQQEAGQADSSTSASAQAAAQQQPAAQQGHSKLQGSAALGQGLVPAPRPPWLRPGAGIEDPAVWGVRRCEQLLADFLARCPSGRYPPIWDQLGLLLVRRQGVLGLGQTLLPGVLSSGFCSSMNSSCNASVAAGREVHNPASLL